MKALFVIIMGLCLNVSYAQEPDTTKTLIQAKELDDRFIDGWMETETTFIRANRGIVLDTITIIDLDLAIIISPKDFELDKAFRHKETL